MLSRCRSVVLSGLRVEPYFLPWRFPVWCSGVLLRHARNDSVCRRTRRERIHGSRTQRQESHRLRGQQRAGPRLRNVARARGRRSGDHRAHRGRPGTHRRRNPQGDRREGHRGARRHHHRCRPRRGARRLPRARHPGEQRRWPAARRFPRMEPRRLDQGGRCQHADADLPDQGRGRWHDRAEVRPHRQHHLGIGEVADSPSLA